MSSNRYFQKNPHRALENNLMQSLTDEAIQIHGFDCFYVPRQYNNLDRIYGEDPISSFTDAYEIEMYLESFDEFEGEGDLFAKFGLEVRDSARFVVSKRRFEEETGMTHPQEGDLIYFPLGKSLMQIKSVEHENPFYQLSKNYSFRLTAELYRYSQEEFSTGIEDIDNIESQYNYVLYVDYSGITGTFAPARGDTVYQSVSGETGNFATSSVRGTVLDHDAGSSRVSVVLPIGEWLPGRFVVTSNETGFAEIVSISDNIDADLFDDNSVIETEADINLNTDEPNRFGVP